MKKRGLKRRDFLKAVGVGAASLALPGRVAGAGIAGPSEKQQKKKPNLLIIHTDQQSCWTIGAYGGDLVQTPHIDALAEKGVRLDNFFTNSAVCTPSRGCLLTGRYPHSHGAYKNNIPINRDERTLAHVLRDAGYDTGYAGKWHLDGTGKPGWMKGERAMGFDDCRFMYNRGHWKSIVEKNGAPAVSAKIGDKKTYTTDWLAARTIDFVSKERERPFFFMVSIPDPHTPFSVRAPYDNLYDAAEMPVPATFHEEGGPEWLKKARGGNKRKKPVAAKKAEESLRRRKAQYCGEVKCIDDSLGRILEALRKKKLSDDTIVVFTTDHGEYMGEHGLFGKNNLFETAYRIPMIIRWPEQVAAGRAVKNVVSTVDFMPTVLGLMGIPPAGREQGRSACRLLAEGDAAVAGWEEEAFVHHSTHERAGIFTPGWELALVKDGGHVLFDRKKDPDQVNNLYANPDHTKIVDELTLRIISHNRKVDAPAAEWLSEFEGNRK
jgi:arylsulfatase A-like enzyme